MSGNVCDVCGASSTIGVFSSALGPASFAYCAACAAEGAEPYGVAVGMVAMMGTLGRPPSLDDLAEWFRPVIWATVLKAGRTAEQWWADVARAAEEMDADLQLRSSSEPPESCTS